MRKATEAGADADPNRSGAEAPWEAPAPPRVEEAGDARLVEQAREGDDHAFATLVARYERALIRVLARLVRDEELARDLAQETFWKVYNRLDRFDTSRRVGPWVFRIGVKLTLGAPPPHEPPAPAPIHPAAGDGRTGLQPPDPGPRNP